MEPSDFDKLIKDKLEQDSDLHQKNIEAAKPFVWTAVQTNLKHKKYLIPWHYAAAAAVLFVVFSSLLFLKTNRHYENELNLLSLQILEMKQQNKPSDLIAFKNKQLDLLSKDVERLETSLTLKTNSQSTATPIEKIIIQKQIVYQVDTVFLNGTAQIAQLVPEFKTLDKVATIDTIDQKTADLESTTQVIFIQPEAKNTTNSNSTALRIKLGNFSNN